MYFDMPNSHQREIKIWLYCLFKYVLTFTFGLNVFFINCGVALSLKKSPQKQFGYLS